jgi:hypothetical protein
MGYYVKQKTMAGIQKTVEEYVIASVRCRRTARMSFAPPVFLRFESHFHLPKEI